MSAITIGIDASNLRAGGGITHLIELLSIEEVEKYNIKKVIVWAGKETINALPEKKWLIKEEQKFLNKNLFFRFWWQTIILKKLIRQSCDILFVPGGVYTGDFRPYVTMSRNMLVFEERESKRFGFSWMRLRFFLLKKAQLRSFRNASGIIFISEYARSYIQNLLFGNKAIMDVINHGVSLQFKFLPKKQKSLSEYSEETPFTFLYVSIINVYKHQWNVAEAVSNLKKKGYPIKLDLVGPYYKPALKRLNNSLLKIDPKGEFINYHGKISYKEISDIYKNADGFVFASSCENMPNILIEAMAAGLPIACSNNGPMPEFLKDAGVYFNPENVTEIEIALETIMNDTILRDKISSHAFSLSENYSWELCANKTFRFLNKVYYNYQSSG